MASRDSIYFVSDKVVIFPPNETFDSCAGFVLEFNNHQYAVTIGVKNEEKKVHGIIRTDDTDFKDTIKALGEVHEI